MLKSKLLESFAGTDLASQIIDIAKSDPIGPITSSMWKIQEINSLVNKADNGAKIVAAKEIQNYKDWSKVDINFLSRLLKGF